MVFVGSLITNAYANLTNVILRVAPRHAQHAKAVLVNAHFDTVFGTPGAGLRPISALAWREHGMLHVVAAVFHATPVPTMRLESLVCPNAASCANGLVFSFHYS